MSGIINNYFNKKKENCIEVVQCFLELLNVNVTTDTIVHTLKTHPYYPSLLSLSDSLAEWKIETVTFKPTINELLDTPPPFIIQTKKENETYFTVLKEINSKSAIISTPDSHSWKTITVADFVKIWTGVTLAAEPLEGAGEDSYKNKKKLQLRQYSAYGFMAVALLIYIVFSLYKSSPTSIYPILFLITKSLGTCITVLLLWYEVDRSNPMLQKICSVGKQTNCSSILQSNASTIWGIISWSEVGFLYFFSGFIFLICNKLNNESLALLSILSLLVSPYTIFSVYYQWRVAKQWCVLCLLIQSILLAESFLVFTNNLAPDLLYETLIVYSIIALLTAGLWITIKPWIIESRKSNYLQLELARIKNDPEIFKTLLKREKAVRIDDQNLGIIIGNPDASVKITSISSPFCAACSESHSILEEIIDTNPNVQLQLIFIVPDDNSDRRALPVKHFMSLYENSGITDVKKAMNFWYQNPYKSSEALLKKFNTNADLEKQGTNLQKMYDWCTKMRIMQTPTYFINGHQLPNNYNINMLKKIIKYL